jgi:hypothetical protein
LSETGTKELKHKIIEKLTASMGRRVQIVTKISKEHAAPVFR